MTSKTQLNRLSILSTELSKLSDAMPAESVRFDMGLWCELTNADSLLSRADLEKQITEATRNPCNTYACLCGKAGLIPRIRRMGFKWAIRELNVDPNYDGRRPCVGEFQYKNLRDHEAIREFFGDGAMDNVFLNHSSIETLDEGIELLEDYIQKETTHNRVYGEPTPDDLAEQAKDAAAAG